VPYRVDLQDVSDQVLDRLVELGALDVEGADGRIAAIMPDDVTPDAVAEAVGGGVDMHVSAARSRDDGSVWILTPRVVQIAGITLVPAGWPHPVPGVRLMDSDAFGTGLHPTTALCLDILQDEIGTTNPPDVLDVGTGSGVLALVALSLGVPHVTAIDVDDGALRVAAENARLNGVASALDFVHGGPEGLSGTWPLVLANVLASPLMEMAPTLVRRVARGGRLVLSGIATSVTRDVEGVYRQAGMSLVGRATRDAWAALVLQASR